MVGSPRIGLDVSADAVRAVALSDGRVVWAASVPATSRDALKRAVSEVLAEAPAGGWRMRRPVVVAIGPSSAQVRRVEGLPPGIHPSIAAAVVRADVGRFCLRNGTPIVPGSVVTDPNGHLWVAAFDAPVVEACIEGVRSAGFRCVAIVPTVSVVAWVLGDTQVEWRDGNITLALRVEGGRLAAARRVLTPQSAPLPIPACLRELADRPEHLAGAYGAAGAELGQVPALWPARTRAQEPVSRRRAITALTALLLAVLVAAVAPMVAARRSFIRSQDRLQAVRVASRSVLAADRELGRFRSALAEFNRLVMAPAATDILEAVTSAMPDSAAIVSLRLDTAGLQVAFLAPSVGRVLERLERVDGFVAPQVVGPVVREALGGFSLERATVRVRLRQ